jgi:outer membrane protein assembly factor BamB
MRRTAFALLALCFPLSGTASAFDNLKQLLPSDQVLARYGLARGWYTNAPVDGVRETVQIVSVVGDQLHLQTNASRIHAVSTESGKVLWTAQVGIPIRGQFGSATNSNSVFVINGSQLFRLDRENGAILWSLRLPSAPNAAPVADEDRVMVNTLDGRIIVYNVNTKELIWYYQTNGPISMPATILDEKIACASEDGKMYVFQVASRNPLVRFQTGAPISAPLGSWGRSLLVPSQDFNLYAVDIRNGDTLWRYSSGSEIRRAVSVVDNDVFLAPEEGGLHAVNAETGERLWRHPRGIQFVAASKSRVYAADRMGQLLILDRSNGRQIAAWNTNQFEFRARNENTDRIYLVTKAGFIVCLHEPANKEPLIHEKVMPAPAPGLNAKPSASDTPSAL